MTGPRSRRRRASYRRRRRRLAALAVVLALVVATPLLFVGPLDAVRGRIFGGSGQVASRDDPQTSSQNVSQDDSQSGSQNSGEPEDAGHEARDASSQEVQEAPEVSRVQPSPAAAAYAAVAPALPGVEPSSVGGTFQSTDDASWAMTGIEAPNRDGYYIVCSEKVEGGWEARRSVLANNPDYPRKGRAALTGLPEDLRESLYPETTPSPDENPEATARELISESPYLGGGWEPVSVKRNTDFARVRLEKEDSGGWTNAYLRRSGDSWYRASLGRSLTAAELPEFPAALVDSGSLPEAGPAAVSEPKPALENVPRDGREETKKGLEEIRSVVEDYDGTVGLYVRGVDGDPGYGIRPEERFYAASVIKLPIMVAVYRKVEAGELSLSETVATEDRDYAGGAGGLQWQEESVSHTVNDYLWMMITQSDNVATNLLIRAVGGPGYVNEVASDLGAEHTKLQNKVTDQRAAAPGLDNYTTPQDMAVVLGAIASGKAANEEHTEAMLGLMRQNDADSWLGLGLPGDAETACKIGWIGGVYNEACLVQTGEEPYVISVFSKYGPKAVGEGASTLEKVSGEVWNLQKPQEEQKDEPKDDSGSESGEKREKQEKED